MHGVGGGVVVVVVHCVGGNAVEVSAGGDYVVVFDVCDVVEGCVVDVGVAVGVVGVVGGVVYAAVAGVASCCVGVLDIGYVARGVVVVYIVDVIRVVGVGVGVRRGIDDIGYIVVGVFGWG